jgi:hypothetical protein
MVSRTCEHCGSKMNGSCCTCPKATLEWIADQRVEIRRKMHELKKLEQSTKRQLEK